MKKTVLVTYHAVSIILFVFLLLPSTILAKPVSKSQAQSACRGWLTENKRPMDRAIAGDITDAVSYTDEAGQILYYVIDLNPQGFVVLSADDDIEPVIAFSSNGWFADDAMNPLKVMLDKDMQGRLAWIQQHKTANGSKKPVQALGKWNHLRKKGGDPDTEPGTIALEGISGVSLIHVDPFLLSQWDQDNVSGTPCYSYYTPNNYPTGCVATAMAQVMRYYSWPTASIGSNAFTISVDGYSQSANTRGGDGLGGAYNWSQMPLVPLSGVTTTQRQAIGALCYDAGVSVEMAYASGGSSASLYDADQAFVTTFLYGSSVYTQSFTSSGDTRLWNILNANLDAQMPVLLSISRTGGGHAVVADGYGYNGGTLYHHINLGWGGSDNAWYQLPTIDAAHTYTVINGAVYNVYTSGSGEIISGRVTNMAGAPLSGVTVRAYINTNLVKQTTTNSRGVYAITKLSSNTTYRISPIKSGETFMDQNVTTGSSTDWSTPGNRGGISFASAAFGPPTAFDIQAQVASTNSITVQLSALDDGEPDPNLLQYIITSLPLHGTLSEQGGQIISNVPYAMLASDANTVTYTPCPYFGGQDTFTYKANDGGMPPNGGDSNIATVTITVNDLFNTDFGVESSTYTSFLMKTNSYYDARAEIILLQSDIGQAQRLTDLAFNIYIIPGRTLTNWTIRMQHTNWSSFSDITNQFLTTGWTTVYQSNQAITGTGWLNFHFSTPFVYNGTQNLLIDFSYNNSGLTSPGGGYFVNTTAANRFLGLASTTGTHGDPLQWNFWSLGGSYYNGSIPSMKLTGEVSITPLTGDVDETCSVKLPDLAVFAHAWQTSAGNQNYNAACDLTATKGTVNLQDLIILSDNWLETYP